MESHFALLALGGLLLAGIVADEIGQRTRLPRVTLLIIFGVVAGPSGLQLLPEELSQWYEFLAAIALTMVAFLLGGSLSQERLRSNGRSILIISLAVVVLTTTIVFGGLLAIGVPTVLAILMAGIATATAPAATQDAIRQIGAEGPFTDTLIGIVAIDDAWGLIVFSILLSFAGQGDLSAIAHGMWELAGAIFVGVAVGVPAALLTGRLKVGEPMQAEALGVVLLVAGMSIWLEVSFLLAGITAGTIVANFARHHARPFHEIENIEWPFMVLFFILSGAALHLGNLAVIGWLGVAFIILRTVSRLLAGWIGASLAGAPRLHRRYIGMALLPQAGVALGMALVASSRFPELQEIIMVTTIGTTVVFELIGPISTQYAIRKVGEAD
jgi:Kef-type K+ transport system membrane component KefB